MWTRDLLKMNAKQVLRNNYWLALLVAFVASLLAGGPSNIGPTLTYNYTTGSTHYNYQYQYDYAMLPYFGAVAAAILGFGLIAFIVGVLFSVFVGNPVAVGKSRYFMESRVGNAPFSSLFSAFGGPAYRNVIKVMFMKNLFIFLWSLLFVIPGIYKAYQYRMVDYLIAENPYMPYQRALELSRQMTDGEKFNIFILELSFIGWLFLGALAFGVGVFFVNPYIAYSVCILPPARYFSATLPNKTRHRAGAVCHCIAGAKALPEVCVLAKPLRQRCNWSINLHRRNWQPM